MRRWVGKAATISLAIATAVAIYIILFDLSLMELYPERGYTVDSVIANVLLVSGCHFAGAFALLAIILTANNNTLFRAWRISRWVTYGVATLAIIAPLVEGISIVAALIGAVYTTALCGSLTTAVLVIAFRLFGKKAPERNVAAITTFRVYGDRQASTAGCTLEVRSRDRLSSSKALSLLIPLMYEHQIGTHRTFRGLVLDAVERSVVEHFEGFSLLPKEIEPSWGELGSLRTELHPRNNGKYSVTVHVKRRSVNQERVSGLTLNHAIPACQPHIEDQDFDRMMFYLLYGWIVWTADGVQFPVRQSIWHFGIHGNTTEAQMLRRIERSSRISDAMKQAARKVANPLILST